MYVENKYDTWMLLFIRYTGCFLQFPVENGLSYDIGLRLILNAVHWKMYSSNFIGLEL